MMRQFYKSKHKEYALVMIGSKKTPYYYQLQKAKAKFDRTSMVSVRSLCLPE